MYFYVVEISISSISKISSDFPGISPGNPLSPYARWAGIVIIALSFFDSCATPISRPEMN